MWTTWNPCEDGHALDRSLARWVSRSLRRITEDVPLSLKVATQVNNRCSPSGRQPFLEFIEIDGVGLRELLRVRDDEVDQIRCLISREVKDDPPVLGLVIDRV